MTRDDVAREMVSAGMIATGCPEEFRYARERELKAALAEAEKHGWKLLPAEAVEEERRACAEQLRGKAEELRKDSPRGGVRFWMAKIFDDEADAIEARS